MKQGFITKQLQRSNRNLILTALLILALSLALFCLGGLKVIARLAEVISAKELLYLKPHEKGLLATGFSIPGAEVAKAYELSIHSRNPYASVLKVTVLHEKDIIQENQKNMEEERRKINNINEMQKVIRTMNQNVLTEYSRELKNYGTEIKLSLSRSFRFNNNTGCCNIL